MRVILSGRNCGKTLAQEVEAKRIRAQANIADARTKIEQGARPTERRFKL